MHATTMSTLIINLYAVISKFNFYSTSFSVLKSHVDNFQIFEKYSIYEFVANKRKKILNKLFQIICGIYIITLLRSKLKYVEKNTFF